MIRVASLAAAAAGLFLAIPGPAFAQEEPEVDCANVVTQFDMNVCSDRDYKAADEALNAAYQKAVAAVQESDRQGAELGPSYVGAVDALKKAQRAWIVYRDGQCELEGFQARGGMMEPMLVSGCLAELSSKRTEELKSITEGIGN